MPANFARSSSPARICCGAGAQNPRPHRACAGIDLAHAAAETRIHDDERIDALCVEPRQPRPNFRIHDDFVDALAAEVESGERDLLVDAVGIDALPTGVFRSLHAVACECEQNEVARLRLGDEGIHLSHDLRPGRVGVEQNDGLDAVPAERSGDILGVRASALQLHGCRQSRIDVDANDERADRSAARRTQVIGRNRAGLSKGRGGRRAGGSQEQHQFAHRPFPSHVEGPQSGAPLRTHSTRRSSAQASLLRDRPPKQGDVEGLVRSLAVHKDARFHAVGEQIVARRGRAPLGQFDIVSMIAARIRVPDESEGFDVLLLDGLGEFLDRLFAGRA